MNIKFASEGIEAACNADFTNPTEAAGLYKIIKRAKAPLSPEDILMTLDALSAAESPLDLPPAYRFHLLKYGLSGYGAVDIRPDGKGKRGKWRMRFRVISNCGNINDLKNIDTIVIEELVEDYHKK